MRWTRGLAVSVLCALTVSACSSDGADGSAEPAAAESEVVETEVVETAAVDADAVEVADAPEVLDVVEQPEWGAVLEEANVVGTFAAREVGSGRTLAWDADRAATPRLPASTFKILNSMIILQTGVLADVDEDVPWDGVDRDIDVWNRDHDLRSGIEVSAVWMYQALAREVGEERMAEWVAAADYGNRDIGGGVDEFWLRGDLRISPLEQLDVLERMVTGELPFDDEVVTAVREIIVREQGDDWAWSHKTGTALSEEPTLGWLVGTTEYDGRTWVFAMNVDLEPVDVATQIDPQVRQSVARRILEGLDALPSS